jgi:integral membrane protein
MSALTRYRVMAFAVGTMLIVLVFFAIPLQYGFGHPGPADVISVVHGLLYIVYLLTVFDLARREQLGVRQLAAMVCAGFLPFLAFFVERRVARRLSVPPEDRAVTPAVRPESLAPDRGAGG